MASPPVLEGETAYAGDPYALRVVIQNTSVGTKTFAAQARLSPSSATVAVTFAVTAEDGTGDDDGNVIVDLYLTGEQTAGLERSVVCDLQQTDDGVDLTLLRWTLHPRQDVTR